MLVYARRALVTVMSITLGGIMQITLGGQVLQADTGGNFANDPPGNSGARVLHHLSTGASYCGSRRSNPNICLD